MRTGQEEKTARLEAKIETNNEKFETLRGTLVFRIDFHQARTEVMQEKTDANLKEIRACQEHVKEEIMADLKPQISCLDSRINVNQENVDACLEEMKAWRNETMT
jgi:hypothetical protein